MIIKNRHEILQDVLKDAQSYPKQWKAIFGKDSFRFSDDYYLFHPNVGLYLLKEFHKNPYTIKGVGGKIARHVDDDLEKSLTSFSGDFGIIQGDIKKIATNLQKGIHPHKIIDAAIHGKDMGLKIPLQGKSTNTADSYKTFKEQLKPSRKKVDAAFDQLTKKERLHHSYE